MIRATLALLLLTSAAQTQGVSLKITTPAGDEIACRDPRGRAAPCSGDIRPSAPIPHYAPTENLEHLDVSALGKATRTIDIAAYVLTDIPVIEALIAAGGRGVKVRVYRDGGGGFDPGATVREAQDRLRAARNVEIRSKRGDGPYMHLKSYCVDGQTFRTGAANFSASGLKQQDNDLVFLGAEACAAFTRNFELMWRR